MRRVAFFALLIGLAAAAGAGTPHSLDRSGVLWSASASPDGLVLTAQRDGAVLVNTLVPFAVPAPGALDSEIQVASDELTGKVAVVWQRDWSAATSDIMLAVWNNGAWERVTTLSGDMSLNPRFPAVQLSRIKSTIPDPLAPDDPTRVTVVEDSFLHVAWWDGRESLQQGHYGLLCLTAAGDDPSAIVQRDLDDMVWLGSGCSRPAPQSALEHPLFASRPVTDRAYLFHGSRRACLFQLLEISFRLDDSNGGASIQRRRHTPVFGVKKLLAVPTSMSLDGARFLVGSDLNPVAYRVTDGKVEYISTSGVRWTPKRSLSTGGDLPIDQAIPLVESLVR